MNEQRTILMVDDNTDDLTLMRESFRRANCTHALQEAHHGEEAIAYLNGDAPYSDRSRYPLPALVLLDLNMPRINGYDVLLWIRAQPALRHLAVYILSASLRNEDVQRTHSLGTTGYLVKPSSLNALTAMMRCICGWVESNDFPPTNEIKKDFAERIAGPMENKSASPHFYPPFQPAGSRIDVCHA